jgi:site-specific recombinase
MPVLFDRIDADTDSIDLLVELMDTLRPSDPQKDASASVRSLCEQLRRHPHQARALRAYLLRIMGSRRHTRLYTDIGILSNDGFFTELKRRISYRILPPALGDWSLSDALDQVLYLKTDHLWISAVPAENWLELFDLIAGAGDGEPAGPVMQEGMLAALRTLSYRVCAIGLEPKLTNIHTDIETFASPFVTQNVEVNAYLDGHSKAGELPDARHLLVMLDQCDTVIARVRRSARQKGTSIALTYLLVVLTQSIERMRKLLFLIDEELELPEPTKIALAAPAKDAGDTGGTDDAKRKPISLRRAAALALALELIEAHNNKYTVADLFADNIDLLARNVTENASRTGEHYVAESRKDLRTMFSAAAGAGFIVGFMAMFKILLSYLRAPPLVEAFLYSMNYSVGFMFIHLLNFTVATKQPAMTASRIAAGLHSADGRNIDLDSMAELINKVLRTQFVAILGNLCVVIPTAYLLATVWFFVTGHHLVGPDKARHLLQELDPIGSLALFYALIAGVGLFIAGLISGYYDNKALYSRMAQRITQVRSLQRLLGPQRVDRLGLYLESNLGALMGNFYFGILLGSMGTLGNLLGLPIDIRHITFSAANFATALVALDHQISWHLAVKSMAGVLGIGFVNLLVSFGLALWVALRSRQVHFHHGFALLKALQRRFWKKPIDFLFGPKHAVENISSKNDLH